MFFLISLVVSVIPPIILYKWLLKSKSDENFQYTCKKALKKGFVATFPVILVSLVLYIIGKILGLEKIHPLIYEEYYTFIALALSEELVKYFCFKEVLKDAKYKYSNYDVVIFMSIVGLGFGISENIVYSFDSGIIPMLIKGITLGHTGYGFIVGYFYGKSLETKDKKYRLLGFLVVWLLHGLFDFGLSEELISLNDNLMIISLGLTLVSIITIIKLIKYVRKNRKNEVKNEEY